METERIWFLMSLQLSGEATPEENSELVELLKVYPEAGLQAELLRNFWQNKTDAATPAKAGSYNRHLQRLSNHLSDPVLQYETNESAAGESGTLAFPLRKRRYYWLWTAAAAAAAVLAFMVVLRKAPEDSVARTPSFQNTVSTKPGLKSKIRLPDGTSVWLNADSHISYDEKFDRNFREVQLAGEAYFDVVKDKTRPFIIHTSTIDIKVLGTAFNVRSYPNEQTTETALIRGRVEIMLHNNPDKKIILKPNEKLVVNNNITDISPSLPGNLKQKDDETMMTLSKIHINNKDSIIAETKWIRDRLEFDGTPFGNIVTELERLYNVGFVVKNDALKKMRFTGSFENKSLAEIMEALHLSGRFHYEFAGDTVTVW
jgi:ferric-dicitrate binding protein FerR (iron transport regulator)